jgi:hypothetical protein
MTLDMLKVGPQLARMGRVLRERASRYPLRRDWARAMLAERAAGWRSLGEVAASSRRRLATPTEPLDARYPLPQLPRSHRVIATDGSQIEPDRHGMADYFLLNVGWAVIEYGTRPRADLDSQPALYFEQDDLYIRQGDRRVPLRDHHLSAKRSGFELARAADLAERSIEDDLPTVVLADGTLLLWVLEDRPEDFLRQELLAAYTREMARIRDLGLPLMSYISRPRSAEVSGLLAEASCRGDVGACRACLERDDETCAFEGLPDRDLFGNLAPGERSARFSMTLPAGLASYYDGQVPQFFYANVGSELARVEFPAWVAERPEWLDLIQSVVVDQCRKGQGYPVVLARAHERALVSMGDRMSFLYLLDGILARQGIPARPSEKQASKNRRAV